MSPEILRETRSDEVGRGAFYPGKPPIPGECSEDTSIERHERTPSLAVPLGAERYLVLFRLLLMVFPAMHDVVDICDPSMVLVGVFTRCDASRVSSLMRLIP